MPQKITQTRRCVSCREPRHKSEFLRIVKLATGEIFIDTTGKAQGRGAYLCKSEKCAADNLKRRRLDKPFKSKVPADLYNEICAAIKNFSTIRKGDK